MSDPPISGPSPQQRGEEVTDVVAFQAGLDDSVAAVRALVNSWIPKDLDARWDEEESGGAAGGMAALLAARARPARMGVGASVSAIHARQAEERKTRDRLLRGTSSSAVAALGSSSSFSTAAAVAGKGKSLSTPAESEDDEEESRASAIKRPKLGLPPPPPPNQAQQTATPPLSVSSNADSSASAPAPPMSKNRRKKERERLKHEAARKAKLEESRREVEGVAEGGEKARGEEDEAMEDAPSLLPSPPSLVGSKRARSPSPSPIKKPRWQVQVPFAPLTSSSSSGEEHLVSTKGRDGKAREAEEEDDSSDDDGSTATAATSAATVSMVLTSPEGAGKKKRRRKKKKTKTLGGSGAGAPVQGVLNLDPLPKA